MLTTRHVYACPTYISHAYSSHFFPGSANVNLVGYSDAEFANSVDDRRSITGYVFLLAGAPLSWN